MTARTRHLPGKLLVVGTALALTIFAVQGGAGAAEATVGLGTAASYGVLAGSTVTNTGPTTIEGDVGVSPGTAVTGFPPGIVTPPGVIHAADAQAAQAKSDLTLGYNDAAGRSTSATVTADLGGQTLIPGVYTASTSLGLTGALTLNAGGDANAVFIFQAGTTLTTASNSSVVLINGANPCNVFWQIGSSAVLGTNTQFKGTILANASITANTSADIIGRLLARTGAVTLDSNTIITPACAPVTTTTETPTTVTPTTVTPTTVAPTTVAPTTVAPTTVAPTTVAPTTVAPTTVAPTTVAPTTVAPTTVAPTTVAPTTVAPTTVAPTTVAPTTVAPTTVAPTTVAPTTVAPTTVAPTTVAPTTVAPTTVAPTTVTPTTVSPTPTTVTPTTVTPTTVSPTPTTVSPTPTTVSPTPTTVRPTPTTVRPTTSTTVRPTTSTTVKRTPTTGPGSDTQHTSRNVTSGFTGGGSSGGGSGGFTGTTSGTPSSLARTGSQLTTTLVIGLVTLLAGGVLVMATRRPTTGAHRRS